MGTKKYVLLHHLSNSGSSRSATGEVRGATGKHHSTRTGKLCGWIEGGGSNPDR